HSLLDLPLFVLLIRVHAGTAPPARQSGQHNWIHGLPFKVRFRHSKLYISVIPPLVIGFIVGLLASIMGVGGGFIMVPAMIYLLHMPTNVVIGTSLFQIVFVTALVTVLHAVDNQTVDIVLALLLLGGGVIGAQFGARAGQHLKGEQLRALLALMVIAVCLRLLFDLLVEPGDLYALDLAGAG
ncbi:MAG: sulfite exporter TauE/SafE family protein, partial [Hyphomicrobiales bacterium]